MCRCEDEMFGYSVGFIKRERQRDQEILTSRLVDRSIRPLFPDGWSKETQILETVMSYDGVNSTEPLAITAAGTALAVSNIPFAEPVVGVRVGWIDGPVVNPTAKDQEKSELDLVLAGTCHSVVMLEGSGNLVKEKDFIEAFDKGVEYVTEVAKQILEWVKTIGKKKLDDGVIPIPSKLEKEIWEFSHERLMEIFGKVNKEDRNRDRDELLESILDNFWPNNLQGDDQTAKTLICRIYKVNKVFFCVIQSCVLEM